MKRAGILVFCLIFLPFAAFAEDFYGYPCTKDCSGHMAGYEWAQRKGITDPSQCGGSSNSFIEGCYAWTEQQDDAADEETDDDAHDEEQDDTL